MICGPQTPLAYCDREAYQRLRHPIPNSDYWERQGMTGKIRRQDWMECGGMPDGGYSSDVQERNKLHRIERCMRDQKGYRYIGPCYDTEISKASPACGAP
jgi:hypothetical protein